MFKVYNTVNSLCKKPKTLFLDRDGVINEKIENNYVKNIDEFIFKKNIFKALSILNNFFDLIIIVTNQRGVGKGLMTKDDLEKIHDNMILEFKKKKIIVNMIIHCPYLDQDNFFRKPNPGMAYLAKEEFKYISFQNSVMVGDSKSDIEFGQNLGMKCIRIIKNSNSVNEFDSLFNYSKSLLDE